MTLSSSIGLTLTHHLVVLPLYIAETYFSFPFTDFDNPMIELRHIFSYILYNKKGTQKNIKFGKMLYI